MRNKLGLWGEVKSGIRCVFFVLIAIFTAPFVGYKTSRAMLLLRLLEENTRTGGGQWPRN